MQNYLNRISVNYPGIPKIANPNGYFGPDTEEAVKAFQKIFNLTSDGIIGNSTWYKISYIYSAVTQLAELETEGDVTVSRYPPDILLRRGDRGDYVSMLQLMLDYVAEFYPEMPFVSIDGQFGPGTENAVKTFQGLMGLTADGIVGKNTWNALFNTYYGLQNATPQINNPQYPGTLLREGSRGDNVKLMQEYLQDISAAYGQIPYISADGIFGPKTTEAVKSFQRAYNLTPDGIIGPATWSKIVEKYNGTKRSAQNVSTEGLKNSGNIARATAQSAYSWENKAQNNTGNNTAGMNIAQGISGVILSRMLFRR
jgi:peptidoglycan hydrolase-like protein with peptidoglycan-binding domain